LGILIKKTDQEFILDIQEIWLADVNRVSGTVKMHETLLMPFELNRGFFW
jgi:hypothetical protein